MIGAYGRLLILECEHPIQNQLAMCGDAGDHLNHQGKASISDVE